MAQYENGRYPLDMFIHVEGDLYLTAGTLEKVLAVIAEAKRRHGWNVYVTPGANGYRWYDKQVEARTDACGRGRCIDAAVPGDSSHGINWRGRVVLAVDFSGYGDRDAWYSILRDCGFEAGVISWEYWHAIDPEPFREVKTANAASMEEDEMLALRISENGRTHFATLGNKVFRHLVESDDVERMKNIIRSDDQWTDVDIAELPRLLTTYGCDVNIYRVENGEFKVADTRTGEVRSGGMWRI